MQVYMCFCQRNIEKIWLLHVHTSRGCFHEAFLQQDGSLRLVFSLKILVFQP